MSDPRVYAADAAEGQEIAIAGDEASHLTRVLRTRAGDRVRVFDGRGAEFDGEVAFVQRSAVRVRVGGPVESVAEPAVSFTVAPALIKGDGFDEIVRDAVMMGAAKVRPMLTERCVVKPRDAMAERWQRVALAAVKQSGRAVLPAVDAPATVDQILASDASALKLAAVEPSADVLVVDPLKMPAPASALVLIGPEGGWSPSELELFKEKGIAFVRIGRRTITAERATIAALAVLMSVWDK